ncbi:DSBA-like thioredoxin domain-containing protein [Entamoeba marina]
MSIRITVVSDVSCPYCYVGKTRMDNAIKQIPDISINVEYHPFIIDSGTNKNGEEYLAYNVRRWGSDGWTYSMKREAIPDGCKFQNWKYWPYSLHCHRLMMYANTLKKGSELMGIFFQMNYEEGKNLSINDGLFEAAKRCGLDDVIVNRIITTNEYNDAVSKELSHWRQMGVSGVPFYIIDFPNGQHETISGACSTKKWVAVLNKHPH